MIYRISMVYNKSGWLYRNNIRIHSGCKIDIINSRSKLFWTIKLMGLMGAYRMGGDYEI